MDVGRDIAGGWGFRNTNTSSGSPNKKKDKKGDAERPGSSESVIHYTKSDRPIRENIWKSCVSKDTFTNEESVKDLTQEILAETYEAVIAQIVQVNRWEHFYVSYNIRNDVCMRLLYNDVRIAIQMGELSRLIEIKKEISDRRWKWWINRDGGLKEVFLLKHGALGSRNCRFDFLNDKESIHYQILTVLDETSWQLNHWKTLRQNIPDNFTNIREKKRIGLGLTKEGVEHLSHSKSLELYELCRETFVKKIEFPIGKIIRLLELDTITVADPNFGPNSTAWYNWTTLHFVCANGWAKKTTYEVLELFDYYDADFVNIPVDAEGNTLLHIAALKGNIPAIQYLMKNSTIEVERANYEGFSPFLCAASMNNVLAMREFLRYTLDERMFLILEGNQDEFLKSQEKFNLDTKLIKCVTEGLPNTVKELLNDPVNPANVEAKDVNGLRPIHVALISNSDEHLVHMVQILIDAKADVNSMIPDDSLDDNASFRPLHIAVSRHHPAGIKVLMENGARLNDVDRYGRTPLTILSIDPENPPNIASFYRGGEKRLRKSNKVLKWKKVEEILMWRGSEYDKQIKEAVERRAKAKLDKEIAWKKMSDTEKLQMELGENSTSEESDPEQDEFRTFIPPMRANTHRDDLLTQFHLFDVVTDRAKKLKDMCFKDQELFLQPKFSEPRGEINDYDRVVLFRHLQDGDLTEIVRRRTLLWDRLIFPMLQMSQRGFLDTGIFKFLEYCLITFGGLEGLCLGTILGHTLEYCPSLNPWDDIEDEIKKIENVVDRCQALIKKCFRRPDYPKKQMWIGCCWKKYEYPREQNSIPWDMLDFVNEDFFLQRIPQEPVKEFKKDANMGIWRSVRLGLDQWQLFNLLFFNERMLKSEPMMNRIKVIVDNLLVPLIFEMANNLNNAVKFWKHFEFVEYLLNGLGGDEKMSELFKHYWRSLKFQMQDAVQRAFIALKIEKLQHFSKYINEVIFPANMLILTGKRTMNEVGRNDKMVNMWKKKAENEKDIAHQRGRRGGVSDSRPILQNDLVDATVFTTRCSIKTYIEIRKAKGFNGLWDLCQVIRDLPSPHRGLHFWRCIFLDFVIGIAYKARQILDDTFSKRFSQYWMGLEKQEERKRLIARMLGSSSDNDVNKVNHLPDDVLKLFREWVEETDCYKKKQRLEILSSMVNQHTLAVGKSDNIVMGRMEFESEDDLLATLDQLRYPQRYGFDDSIILTEYRNGFHPTNFVSYLPALSKKIFCIFLVEGIEVMDIFKYLNPEGVRHLVCVELCLSITKRSEKLCKLVGLISDNFKKDEASGEVTSYPSMGPHKLGMPINVKSSLHEKLEMSHHLRLEKNIEKPESRQKSRLSIKFKDEDEIFKPAPEDSMGSSRSKVSFIGSTEIKTKKRRSRKLSRVSEGQENIGELEQSQEKSGTPSSRRSTRKGSATPLSPLSHIAEGEQAQLTSSRHMSLTQLPRAHTLDLEGTQLDSENNCITSRSEPKYFDVEKSYGLSTKEHYLLSRSMTQKDWCPPKFSNRFDDGVQQRKLPSREISRPPSQFHDTKLGPISPISNQNNIELEPLPSREGIAKTILGDTIPPLPRPGSHTATPNLGMSRENFFQ